MNNFSIVTVEYSRENLLHEMGGSTFGKAVQRNNLIQQFSSGIELSNYKNILFVLIILVNFQNIRVILIKISSFQGDSSKAITNSFNVLISLMISYFSFGEIP